MQVNVGEDIDGDNYQMQDVEHMIVDIECMRLAIDGLHQFSHFVRAKATGGDRFTEALRRQSAVADFKMSAASKINLSKRFSQEKLWHGSHC
jgi:hypothetical protein